MGSRFNCDIDIPDKKNDDCTVTIKAKSAADLKKVQSEIEKELGFKVDTAPLETAFLDIDPRNYGRVIGRRGATLQEIEKKTRCNINIPRDPKETTLVEVQGPSAGVKEAIELISDAIGEKVKVKKLSDDKIAEISGFFKKLDLASKPITEALFFPDTDPKDGYNFDRFIEYLESATKSLHVCVFTITDNRIAKILEKHHKDGLDVKILTDNLTAEELGSDTIRMKETGMAVRMDKSEYHMHHKFAIVDGILLINGSFNWTRTASLHNYENVTITNSKDLVSLYDAEFDKLWKGSDFEK